MRLRMQGDIPDFLGDIWQPTSGSLKKLFAGENRWADSRISLGKLIHLPVPSGTTTLFKVFLREVNSPGIISVLLSTKVPLFWHSTTKEDGKEHLFPSSHRLPSLRIYGICNLQRQTHCCSHVKII